jgi:hypothetical protein
VQGLRGADPSLLAKVELVSRNAHLWWDELNVQYTVDQLVAGLFGNKRWMSELGRQGGRAISKAKAKASRENGKKGGRPKKEAA